MYSIGSKSPNKGTLSPSRRSPNGSIAVAAAYARSPISSPLRAGGSPSRASPMDSPRSLRGPGSPIKSSVDNVKVYVRLRSFSDKEMQDLDPSTDLAIHMKGPSCDVTVGSNRPKQIFTFDECFWSNHLPNDDGKPYISQKALFGVVGLPLVNNAFEGFNSAIIAYGQTGSGKTYSIFGPPGGEVHSMGKQTNGSHYHNGYDENEDDETKGLIPRVCDEIFERISKSKDNKELIYSVHVSMLEIYLEECYDLLNARQKLTVRQDTAMGFNVVGSRQFKVSSFGEVLRLIQRGDSLKTFASTAINDRSSRAHTLFQLELRAIKANQTKIARVVLADLAGCERIKIAKTDSGTALEEACNINLSLLTLGTCIENAVQRIKSGKSLENMGEFRQSTLTKLLKDYIGGNSRTAILVAIAPHIKDVNLSLQALRFADRAKQIQCHAQVNFEDTEKTSKIDEEALQELLNRKKAILDRETELEKEYATVKQKQDDLAEMSKRLESERHKLEDSHGQFKTSDEEKQKLEARLQEIEAKLRALSKELNDSEQQRGELEQKLIEVCEANAIIMKSKDKLEKRVQEQLTAMEAFRKEILVLRESKEAEAMSNAQAVRVLGRKIDEGMNEAQALREENGSWQARVAALEAHVKELEKQSLSLLEKNKTLEEILAQKEQDLKSLKHFLKESRTKNDHYNRIISEHDNALRGLNAKLQEVTGERDILQEQCETVRSGRTEATNKVQLLQTDLLEHEETFRVTKSKLSHVEAERDSFQEQLENVKTGRNEATKKTQQLQHALANMDQSMHALQLKLSQIEEERSSFQRQCESLKSSHLEVSGKTTKLENTLAERNAIIDRLNANLNNLNDILAAKDIVMQAEISQQEFTDHQIQELRNDLESTRAQLKTSIRDSEAERESLKAEISNMFIAHTKEIDDLTREKDEALYGAQLSIKRELLNEQLRAQLLSQQCQAAKKTMENALKQFDMGSSAVTAAGAGSMGSTKMSDLRTTVVDLTPSFDKENTFRCQASLKTSIERASVGSAAPKHLQESNVNA